MKYSGRFLHLALAALALVGLVMSRALWLAPMTMLWSSTARADNPIWTPYQVYQSSQCSGSTSCEIAFPQVNTETLIVLVSCAASLSTSATAYTELYVQNGNVRFLLPTLNYGAFSVFQLYETNTPTYAFVSTGNNAAVEMNSSSGTITGMDCAVSGYTRSALPPLAETTQPAGPLPPMPAGLPQSPGLPPFLTRVPAQ